jgi:dipeptidyl aminopeptidase/acylaminoacyl peptidase
VPAPIAESALHGLGAARLFADAGAGTLVYQSGVGSASVRLIWLDRAGARVAELGEPGFYLNPSLSAATGKIAVMVMGASGRDIWVVDGTSGNAERFTFEPSAEVFPVFSPDGRSIAFSSNASGPYQILVKQVGGSGAARTLVVNENPSLQPLPRGFTPDGRELLYCMGGFASTATTVFSVAVDGQSPPRRLVESSHRYPIARVSPDGRWLLFGTSVGTAPSLLVTDYPAATRRWQVAFGSSGWWSRDGSELYFLDPERRFSVIGVRAPRGAFEWGPVRELFRTVGQAEIVGGDGNRFLALESPREQDASSSRLELILDWESLLDRPRH